MSFSVKTNNFLKSLDVNKNGVSAAEIKKLDTNKDNILDDQVKGKISPQDISAVNDLLQKASETNYSPSEIVFPKPSKNTLSVQQMPRLAPPNIPWPLPKGIKIPEQMLREKFGFSTSTPEKAIANARRDVNKIFTTTRAKITYDKDLKPAGQFFPETGEIRLGNDAFSSPGKLKATIAHELVHQHHFLNERLFSQPLGQSEKEAYEFVIQKADRLGLSKYEVYQQKILLEKVLSDWKSGVEPGYAKPVTKPSDFEKWKFLLQ